MCRIPRTKGDGASAAWVRCAPRPGHPIGGSAHDDLTLADLARLIESELERVACGGQRSWLIVSHEWAYLQFLHAPHEGWLFSEAVSDHFLLPARRLADWQHHHLLDLGFQAPRARRPNYFRDPAHVGDGAARDLAWRTVRAMAEVYGLAEDDTVSLERNIEPPGATRRVKRRMPPPLGGRATTTSSLPESSGSP